MSEKKEKVLEGVHTDSTGSIFSEDDLQYTKEGPLFIHNGVLEMEGSFSPVTFTGTLPF